MTTKPREIREGRAFLQKRNLRTSDVNPKDFVGLSKRLGKSFYDTLKVIATLQLGGQGNGPFPETERALEKEKK